MPVNPGLTEIKTPPVLIFPANQDNRQKNKKDPVLKLQELKFLQTSSQNSIKTRFCEILLFNTLSATSFFIFSYQHKLDFLWENTSYEIHYLVEN